MEIIAGDYNIEGFHLVGVLEHFLFFHSVGNVIIPTDFHSIIFQRGGSTTLTRRDFIYGGFQKWGYPFIAGWFFSGKIASQ
jgi:hypothetical protein